MIQVSIVGGSGYAGGELLRILIHHPKVKIKQVVSRKFANQPISIVHPNLRKITHLLFSPPEKLQSCDLLFVALPNKISMTLMNQYLKIAKKIIDLGADFRLHDQKLFEKWYQQKHSCPALLKHFTYGLVEIHREEIKKANYVACPGCEATASILALYPLVKNKLINENIIIDAKMSSSQGGSTPSPTSHHPERAGAVRSYKPTSHRHAAEIIQELSVFLKGIKIFISATAIEMVRGLLVTIQTFTKKNLTEKDIWKIYRQEYRKEPFIRIIKEKQGNYRFPEPKILAGTNYCDIGFELEKETNRLVVISAIDNLVKGTAGQAVQAMNVMFNFKETLGLEFPGLHPI